MSPLNPSICLRRQVTIHQSGNVVFVSAPSPCPSDRSVPVCVCTQVTIHQSGNVVFVSAPSPCPSDWSVRLCLYAGNDPPER